MNLETKVPRIELYEKRIASSKPSLGFFCAARLFGSHRHLGVDLQQHRCGDRRHDRGSIDGPDPQPCLWSGGERRQVDSPLGRDGDIWRGCGGRNGFPAEPDAWNQQRAIGNHRPDVAQSD